jgi:hypothetical protein
MFREKAAPDLLAESAANPTGFFFGQFGTRELRNFARFVQTGRFAFSLVTRSVAHICDGIAQHREIAKVGAIPVARSLRRKENFACVRIFYWGSGRKTDDLDVTGIRRERTGN